MKLKDGKTVKLTKVMYFTQAVKTNLSISRLVSKGATMGANQYKMIIKKNGGVMNLDSSKFQNKSILFYLKANGYALEGKEALTNMTEKKMETSDGKKEWCKKLGL